MDTSTLNSTTYSSGRSYSALDALGPSNAGCLCPGHGTDGCLLPLQRSSAATPVKFSNIFQLKIRILAHFWWTEIRLLQRCRTQHKIHVCNTLVSYGQFSNWEGILRQVARKIIHNMVGAKVHGPQPCSYSCRGMPQSPRTPATYEYSQCSLVTKLSNVSK